MKNQLVAIYLTFIVLGLLYVEHTRCEQYYIVPSPNTPCPTESCMLLNEYAANASQYHHVNITLILLQGNHSLDVELSISNMTEISILGQQDNEATITCSSPGRLMVMDVDHLYINTLRFQQCELNQISSVGQFLLDESIFIGGTDTALILHEANGEISNVRVSNTTTSLQGGAIICQYSNVWISNTVFEGNIASFGGAIYTESQSNVTITDCTFFSNSAAIGGSLYAQDDSNIIVQSCKFIANVHTGYSIGGALYLSQSVLKAVNSTFQENQALYGAAIGARQTNVNINDCFFMNNRAQIGGVLYGDGRSIVTVESSVFDGNAAGIRGGAFYLTQSNLTICTSIFERSTAQQGGVIESQQSESIAITNSTFQNNGANQGGVVYAETVNNVTINNSSFYLNICPVGGVLYAAMGSNIFVHSSEFNNNGMSVTPQSTSQGGVFVIRQSNIMVTDSTFVNNSAINGGAFNCVQSTSQITNSSFSRNILLIDSSGLSLGGALSLSQSILRVVNTTFQEHLAILGGVIGAQSQSNVAISNCSFTNNRAQSGGVLYGDGRSIITVEFSEYESNFAIIRGGAFYLTQCNLTLSTNSFEQTTAQRGGVIDTHQSGNISIANSTFQNNGANQGGVVNAETENIITVSNSSFYFNICPVGGVLYAAMSSEIFVHSSEFSNNGMSVTPQNTSQGGVFVIRQSNIMVTESYFINNSAISGGAFYCAQSTSQITNSSFSRNYGLSLGGALSLSQSILRVVNTTFRELQSIRGGVIAAQLQSDVSIINCFFINNGAQNGGVLYDDGRSIITVEFSGFEGNFAVERGGAFYLTQRNLTMSTSSFEQASAQQGGVIETRQSGSISITNSTFQNSVALQGGVVNAETENSITINNSSFYSNTCPVGGVLYAAMSSEIFVHSSKFSNNGMSVNLQNISQGGVFVIRKSNIVVIESNFINNSAISGGVFYCVQSTSQITNSSFSRNDGLSLGGALSLSQSILRVVNTTFRELQSIRGGVIAAQLQSDVSIINCFFINNGAQNGGVLYGDGRSIITVEFSEYESNFAVERGGTFFLIQCNLTLSTSSFEQASAQQGGVIETQQFGNILITNSTFQNNTATQGGVVNAETENSITINNSSFYFNTCPVGGVLYVAMSSDIYVHSCEFNNNGMSVNLQSTSQGGVFVIWQSNIMVTESNFINNSAIHGGAFYCIQSTLQITNSSFFNNYAQEAGGVLTDINSRVDIMFCEFNRNTAARDGGALFFSSSVGINLTSNIFRSNQAGIFAGAASFHKSFLTDLNNTYSLNTAFYAGALYAESAIIMLQNSSFIKNRGGSFGGAIATITHIYTTILNCDFDKNTALIFGGALFFQSSSSLIAVAVSMSKFHDNNGGLGGAVCIIDNPNVELNTNMFNNNSAVAMGGAIYTSRANMSLHNTSFYNNTAAVSGGAIITFGNERNSFMDLTFMHNLGNSGIVTLFESGTTINGFMLFRENKGSLTAIASDVTIYGNSDFVSGVTPKATNLALPLEQGGGITLFQSSLYLYGTCTVLNNSAETGGGIYATESRLQVFGSIMIANNTAETYGGGAYLFKTELTVVGDCMLQENSAIDGGGIYSLGSTITMSTTGPSTAIPVASQLTFSNNEATHGGAVYLKGNSKLYTYKLQAELLVLLENYVDHLVTTNFISNTAVYGGAVYIDDESTGICQSSSTQLQVVSSECQFQTIAVYDSSNTSLSEVRYKNTFFSNNTAKSFGDNIYGGLFDRCTVSPLAELLRYDMALDDLNGISYLRALTSILNVEDSIASSPVRVCFCENGTPNCSYNIPYIQVKKGQTFPISVAAVDQIDQPITGIFYSYLFSKEGGLSEQQTTQNANNICTDLHFSIASPNDFEELVLYAEGPCDDEALSRREVKVVFLPCNCSVGFTPTGNEKTCDCICDDKLKGHTMGCNSTMETFIKSDNSWIGFITQDDPNSLTVHSNCPYNYCQPPNSLISLSAHSTTSSPCRFNRMGILCGACNENYTLSLGSSHCLRCHTYWPGILALIIVVAVISGIMLVVIILALNITVAVGTINAIIFYANIVASNDTSFFSDSPNSFPSILTAWLNLNLGLDVCLFEGMDAYTKTWLKMLFPSYIILIVVVVILISQCSDKFANLIAKRHPAPTLATLVLLSYTTFLQIIITVFSFTIIGYPDGSRVTVWLPDGNVKYLHGKHIALFVVALFIFAIGIAYTLLLFSWQWLVRYSNKKIFKWITQNGKIQHIVETYLAPYKDKHRYWTGLLLLVRVILYLTSAANVSGDPQIQLVSVVVVIGSLLLLKGVLMDGVYKQWPIDVLESILLFNILAFAALTMYSTAVNGGSQLAISWTSTIITAIALLIVIAYHVYVYALKPNGFKIRRVVLTNCFRRTRLDLRHIRQTPVTNIQGNNNSNTDSGRFNDILYMMTPPGTLDYRVQRQISADVCPEATTTSLTLPDPRDYQFQERSAWYCISEEQIEERRESLT